MWLIFALISTALLSSANASELKGYSAVELELSQCPSAEWETETFKSATVTSACKDWGVFEARGDLSHPSSKTRGPVFGGSIMTLIGPHAPQPYEDKEVYARFLRGSECRIQIRYPTRCSSPSENKCPIEHTTELRAMSFGEQLLRGSQITFKYQGALALPIVATAPGKCPF